MKGIQRYLPSFINTPILSCVNIFRLLFHKFELNFIILNIIFIKWG